MCLLRNEEGLFIVFNLYTFRYLSNDINAQFQILVFFSIFCVPKDLKMRYVAAACLTALAGKEVNAENIEKIVRYTSVEDKRSEFFIRVWFQP